MNDQKGTIIMLIIGAIIIYLIFKGLKSIGKSFKGNYTEQEQRQAVVNFRANEQDDGPGGGLKNKKGGNKILWLIISGCIAYLLFFSQFSEDFLKVISELFK